MHLIRDAILRTGHKPLAYLSASAIGYYGDPGEAWVRESDTPIGTGFKAETSVLWEQAAQTVADLGIPTFVFRIGIVLAVEGGALKPIIQPLRWGLGTYFADGQAWWSWVHRDDLCRMFCWAIENQGRAGIYNAVAPQPARNLPLTKAVAKAMRQWAVFLPVPAFMLRLVFGEMADVILDSAKVSAGKIEKAGFSFQFPDLEGALTDILR